MVRYTGIYSKKSKKDWIQTKPEFKDKELLVKSYQVMQRWEDNYMKSLAALATSRGGQVLEVGFGMGISAGYIQKSKHIELHTVIECHPAMYESAKQKFKHHIAKGRMKVRHGFWEDVAPKIRSKTFDGILFDSCPLDSGVEFFQFFAFFKEAFRLLKDDGIFTYFSDEPKGISRRHQQELKQVGFSDIDFRLCKVNPPKSCEYWKHKTIVIPIVKK